MNNIYFLILAGFFGGLIGGMGLGGGTLLIPILTLIIGVFQKEAQAINLISFIPMAIIALIVHKKNGLIKFEGAIYIIIPAVITSYLASILVRSIDGATLQRFFGFFLIALGIYQIFYALFFAKHRNLSKK